MMIEKGTCLLAIFSPMQWHAFEFLCVRWWLLRLSCTIHSVSFTLTDSTKLEWKNTHNLIYVWKNAYFVVPSLCFKPYINSCNSRVKAAEADKCRCVCVWRHKRDTQWHNPMNCRCALRWNEWTHFIIYLWFFFFLYFIVFNFTCLLWLFNGIKRKRGNFRVEQKQKKCCLKSCSTLDEEIQSILLPGRP